MAHEWTKEMCLEKYRECKLGKNGRIPKYDEFLSYAGIPKPKFKRLFGGSAYSKLQIAAGDSPNRLQLQRKPIETIMRQYGNLVIELGVLPPYDDWDSRGFRPKFNGLRDSHKIIWSEFPKRFVEWVNENNVAGFEKAIEIIAASRQGGGVKPEKADFGFLKLIKDIRNWSPARRRNSEGEYKIELRKHLESLRYKLNEEFGESNCDLVVRQEYAIEVKKDPDLAEYDRLFGQVARHLQHYRQVIVLIFQATRNEKYDNFNALVDKYLNIGNGSVEIIKK